MVHAIVQVVNSNYFKVNVVEQVEKDMIVHIGIMRHGSLEIYQHEIDQRNGFIPYQWLVIVCCKEPVKEEQNCGKNQ